MNHELFFTFLKADAMFRTILVFSYYSDLIWEI